MRRSVLVLSLLAAACQPPAPWVQDPDRYPKPVFTDKGLNEAMFLLSLVALVPLAVVVGTRNCAAGC